MVRRCGVVKKFSVQVWSEVERVSKKHADHSREVLKRSIQDTIEKMDRAVVKRVFGRFRSWFERMVAVEGGHME